MENLRDILQAKGVMLFAVVDHSGEGRYADAEFGLWRPFVDPTCDAPVVRSWSRIGDTEDQQLPSAAFLP